MFSRLLLWACISAVACANPITGGLVQHESRRTIPDGFVKANAAPAEHVLTLRIGLARTDMAGLEKALYDVSTPGSALYGQHLSKEEVEAFVAPSSETTSLVNEWLSSNEISAKAISSAGDWLEFTVPVSKANSMLGADFSVFSHQPTGKQIVRTLAYSIPENLKVHIEVIHPTTAFDIVSGSPTFATIPKPLVSAVTPTSDTVPASCATLVTPACLQSFYGIPADKANHTSSTLGVSGFIDQFANSADLATFLGRFRPELNGTTFSLQSVDGGTNLEDPGDAGIEANLDIQYTVGVASGVPTSFISVGPVNNDGLDGFIDIINFLLNQTNPPNVLSTSYGFNEFVVPDNLAINLCNAYMQLSARGTSILFSSGDGGVSGSQTAPCIAFVPTFPSGCPFVTSVGATTGIQETSATFSSGGFSELFPRPSYQSSAVQGYLNSLGSTNQGRFNVTGRAFPDVAAQGQNVVIFVGGQEGTVAGTSCSTPIFASIIALLNDQLLSAGKPVLGFLNPLLYSTAASTFTDITTGNNPGCHTNGFFAATGWDPVTGLGTPNFAKLQAAVGL